MTRYIALTSYDVEIPKSFADRKSALEWAETDGDRFGCARVVQVRPSGQRTVWRRVAEQVAA